MPYFIFNNKNSKDYNIYINEMPPFHAVDEEGEYIEVPGRDGYLYISENRKGIIEKPIKATIYPDNYLNQIKKWLKGSGNLILSTEPDVYFKARVQPIKEYVGAKNVKTILIAFTCQPWAYLLTGNNPITITAKDTRINNPEEMSKPLIKIYGNGPVDLIINSKIHKFNINEYVEVDSELMESYKGTSLATFTGDFPELSPGQNNITWDGTVTKIEVVPRWRR